DEDAVDRAGDKAAAGVPVGGDGPVAEAGGLVGVGGDVERGDDGAGRRDGRGGRRRRDHGRGERSVRRRRGDGAGVRGGGAALVVDHALAGGLGAPRLAADGGREETGEEEGGLGVHNARAYLRKIVLSTSRLTASLL